MKQEEGDWDYLAWKRGGSHVEINLFDVYEYLKGGCKEKGAGSSQWCLVTGPEVMGTNWNVGGSSWTVANTFLL